MSNSLYLAGRGGFSCGCLLDGSYFLSDKTRQKLGIDPGIDKVIDAVIQNVHQGEKNTPAQDRAIVTEQYAQLRQAVKEGYGLTALQVEYGGVNSTMIRNLQTNVAVFSAFKKHDMMRELVKELRDEKGGLKEYVQFRQDALSLVGDYREKWLKIEYDTAVRGSRMATVWENIQKTKKLYPNIKYIISRSAHKREDHLSLVGIILPIDHPFWAAHFPPNGYQCKCSAKPTDEQPTHSDDVPTLEIDQAFAFNPGIDGKVFNVEKHPYGNLPQKEYKEAAKAAWGALCSFERKELLKTAKETKLIDKKIKVPGVPAPVELNRNTFEKNLAFDHYFFDKLQLLNKIDEVLADSQVITVENRKPKQHVKQYHVLQHTTSEGKRINLHVEERKDGQCVLYYLHIQK